jgi:hypothetical protein
MEVYVSGNARTINQVAEDGPLCRAKIYQEINEGRLIARKAGRTTIITDADWEAYLKSLPRLTEANKSRTPST